ncbi:MAG: nucleoside triphosphate pyrophosphohydrolase [Gammaproteobacteria bacterium]|nr:nucleoside triphosphate pyrophosphohydrolase [Gammaproteobacteria bacterium]
MQKLIEIMQRLRDPDTGCPWDREQTFSTIARHTIEEAYEVADAIQREAMDELRDELGDLLFQVVFYTQMAREQSLFDFDDVVHSICTKMIRRHPHVFADEKIESADEQSRAWERHKSEERRRKGGTERPASQLDGVAHSMPALIRAGKLQKRAADVGFDWPDIEGPIAKVTEELAEVRAELGVENNQERLEAEIGDLLFACVNLARHAQVDPESSLRLANLTFERRYRAMEQMLATEGRQMSQLDLEAMEQLWVRAKAEER